MMWATANNNDDHDDRAIFGRGSLATKGGQQSSDEWKAMLQIHKKCCTCAPSLCHSSILSSIFSMPLRPRCHFKFIKRNIFPKRIILSTSQLVASRMQLRCCDRYINQTLCFTTEPRLSFDAVVQKHYLQSMQAMKRPQSSHEILLFSQTPIRETKPLPRFV